MAELIDKNKLKSMQEINKANFNSIEGIREWIDSQPTTTEAEIRAKAYDRFLTEMLNEFDSKNADIEKHKGSYVVSRLREIAEQLKGE